MQREGHLRVQHAGRERQRRRRDGTGRHAALLPQHRGRHRVGAHAQGPGRRGGKGRGEGQEGLRRPGAARQDAGRGRSGRHRRAGGQCRRASGHERHRLRPDDFRRARVEAVPAGQAGKLAGRAVLRVRLHHLARAAQREDPRHGRHPQPVHLPQGRAHHELCARRPRGRGGAGGRAGRRPRRLLCDRFPERHAARSGRRDRHSAPGRLHPGERGELRRDGRRADP